MKNLRTVTLLAVIVAMQFVVTASPAWAQQAHVDKTDPLPGIPLSKPRQISI